VSITYMVSCLLPSLFMSSCLPPYLYLSTCMSACLTIYLSAYRNFMEPFSQNTPPIYRPPSIVQVTTAVRLFLAGYLSPATRRLLAGVDRTIICKTRLSKHSTHHHRQASYHRIFRNIGCTQSGITGYRQTTWILSTATRHGEDKTRGRFYSATSYKDYNVFQLSLSYSRRRVLLIVS
jgi:hypothetical protein